MTAIGSDYVLGIGIQLNEDSINAFERQLQTRLDKVFPGLKILNQADADAAVATLSKVTQGGETASAAISKMGLTTKEAAAAWKDYDSATKSVQLGLDQVILKQDGVVVSAKQAAAKQAEAAQQAADEIKTSTISALNQVTDAYRAAAVQQSAIDAETMQARILSAREATDEIKAMMRSSTVNTTFGDKYLPQLNETVNATDRLAAANKRLGESSGWVTHFGQSLGNIATWTIATTALFGAAAVAAKGFQDAIKSQQEQVIQGFYYHAAGNAFTQNTSNATMSAAIQLAREYGADVMRVQEAIGLWAKVDGGDLNSSLALTNNLLKLTTVTGMDTEEAYRDTVGMLGQFNLALSKQNDLYNIAVGLATKYGGGIKMLGGESEDAAAQMIEAMDRASAVVASFMGPKSGLFGVSEAAAMVQTLIHFSGAHMTGTTAGQQVSQALNTFSKGASHEAILGVGIKLKDNPHFFDQIVQKWNETVPGMGKTLGDVLSQGVSPFARESFDLLVKENAQIDKMRAEAEKFAKTDPLEKMWSSLKTTNAVELSRLKSGFEGLSIVIGRTFLPELNNIVKSLNSGLIPELIAAGPSVGVFMNDLKVPTEVIFGFEALKLAINGFASMQMKFGAATVAVRSFFLGVPAEELFAKNAFTDFQRGALASLTTNGVVTDEMEVQFRALATSKGLTVDQMLLAIGREKGAFTSEAVTLEGAVTRMKGSMAQLAGSVGLETEAIEGSLNTMAISATDAGATLGEAFSAALGPIGMVLTALSLLPAGIDLLKNHNKAKVLEHLQYDQGARVKAENLAFMQARADRADAAVIQHNLNTGNLPWVAGRATAGYGASGYKNDSVTKAHQKERSKMEAQLAKLQQDAYEKMNYAKGLQDGTLFPDYFQKALARGQQNIKHKMIAPPGTDFGGNELPTSPKGTPTDYANQNVNANQQKAQFAALLDTNKALITGYEDQAERLTHLISIEGESEQMTSKLVSAYRDEIAANESRAASLEKVYLAYEQIANQDKTKASHYTKGTKEYDGWMNHSSHYSGLASQLLPQIQEAKDAVLDLDVAIKKAGNDYNEIGASRIEKSARIQWDTTKGQYNSGHVGIGALLGLQTQDQAKLVQLQATPLSKDSPALQSMKSLLTEIGTAIDSDQKKFTDFSNTQIQNAKNSYSRTQASIIPTDSSQTWLNGYNEQIASINKQWDDFVAKYNTEMNQAAGSPGAQAALNQAYAFQDAWHNNALAVADYNAAVQSIASNPTYQAFVSVLTMLANGVNTMITSGSQQGLTNQINAFSSGIGNIDFEKTMLSMSPFAKYNKLGELQLSQQGKNWQNQERQLENKKNHPSFGQSMFNDISKSFADSFTKDLENDFETELKNALIPSATTQQMQTTQQQFQTAVTTQAQSLSQFHSDIQQVIQQYPNGFMVGGGAGGTSPLGVGGTSDGLIGSTGIASLDTQDGIIGTLIGSTNTSSLVNSLSVSSSPLGGASTSSALFTGNNSVLPPSALASVMLGSSNTASAGGGGGSSAGGSSSGGGGSYSPASSSSLGGGGGGSSGGSGGATAGAAFSSYMGMGGASTIPSVLATMGVGSSTATGGVGGVGAGSGGATGATNASQSMSLLGSAAQTYAGISMASSGASKGGIGGGIEAGMGTDAALVGISDLAAGGISSGLISGGLGSALGMGAGLLATAAPYIGAAVMLATMFTPQYSPSTNPDMFANDGYAQGVANAMGYSITQASGEVYEDPGLAQELGGMTELQYMTSWYNQYPGGTGLDASALQLWSEIGTLTGNGKGISIGGLHQGNIFIGDGHGQQVGMSGNWQDVLNDVDTYTQDLYTLLSTGEDVNTPIISVNSYGGSGMGAGFSPWYTPGLTSGQIGATLNAPYGATAAAAGVASGAGISGMPTAGIGANPASPGNSSVSLNQNTNFTSQLNVDGQTLAKIVNAYNYQRQVQGFAPNT